MTDPKPSSSYSTHRQLEFALAGDLDRLRALAAELGMSEVAKRIARDHDRIADRFFSIAVVGEFKRGKSTFINALLGKEILPADIAPTSATINRVTYGVQPAVRIRFRDHSEDRWIGIAELADYVTKLTSDSAAMARTVEEATVYYPLPLCRQNVDILDTPGLADEAAMSQVTLSLIPEVDAAIFVILATAPFSQSESAFLEKLLIEYSLRGVIFVVTALDRLRTQREREQVVESVRNRIRERIEQHAAARFGKGCEAYLSYLRRVGEPKVFGVSGQDALTGKLEGNPGLLEESRFPELEAYLERFLTEESGLLAVKTNLERTMGFTVVLRKKVVQRLSLCGTDSSETTRNILDDLLFSLDWLAGDLRQRLKENQSGAQIKLRSTLQDLPQVSAQAAGEFLNTITMSAEDLEPARTDAWIRERWSELAGRLHSMAEEGAQFFARELAIFFETSASELARFGVVFDRTFSYVRGDGTVEGQRSSLFEDMGSGLPGFDRSQFLPAVMDSLWHKRAGQRSAAFASALSLRSGWAQHLSVQPAPATGPKIMKKAVDFLRIEAFKPEFRKKSLEGIGIHLQQTWTERERTLDLQVSESFAVLERRVDLAVAAVQEERTRLKAAYQRELALREHDRAGLENIDRELREIAERSEQTLRHLDALQTHVGRGAGMP